VAGIEEKAGTLPSLQHPHRLSFSNLSGAIPVVCVLDRVKSICQTQQIKYTIYISIFYQATCFDPLKGSCSGRGIIKVIQKS
jgi:hypothetical protein